jgi:hypothetical protein
MKFEKTGNIKTGLQLGLWNRISKQVDEINRNGSFFPPILKIENERIICNFTQYNSYNIFLNNKVSHIMSALKRPIEFIGNKNNRLFIGGARGFPSGTSFKTKTLYIENIIHDHIMDLNSLDFDVRELFIDFKQLNERNIDKLKNLNFKVFINIKHECLSLEDCLARKKYIKEKQ